MNILSRLGLGCMGAVAIAGLAACSAPPEPTPDLTPVMANPPPAPVPMAANEAPAVAGIPDTARPVPTPDVPDTNHPLPAAANPALAGAAMADGSAAIPGASDPWLEIKDYPFSRRTDFVARVDGTMPLLHGAVSVVRLSQPKPNVTEAHATAIKNLDTAMTALDQALSGLTYASEDRWEGAKNDFHSAWLNVQAAYAQAKLTGN
ncbi:MAG TPA: hypothetical protein VG838_14355 [Opitutaceae bacterium]|nr:hypothetical protein [Opitutaceae bacterium]